MIHKRIPGISTAVAAILLGVAACAPPPAPYQPEYNLLSLGEAGALGNGDVSAQVPGSGTAAMVSADGNHTAFTTESDNVLPDDPGSGIFLRDNAIGEVQRVADRSMDLQNLSPDGRYVIYTELAPDSGNYHLYVYDGDHGSTRSISVPGSEIGYKPTVTPDGSKIIHGGGNTADPQRRPCAVSDLNGGPDMDCPIGGQGRTSIGPVTSSNGRFVVTKWFGPANSTGWNIWDRSTDSLTEIQVPVPSVIGPVSDDGRFVLSGPDLAASKLVDLATNSIIAPPGNVNNFIAQGVSRDARYVLLFKLGFDRNLPSGGGYHLGYYRWDTAGNTLMALAEWDDDHLPDLANSPHPIGGCSILTDLTDDGGICTLTGVRLDPTDTNGKADVYLAH